MPCKAEKNINGLKSHHQGLGDVICVERMNRAREPKPQHTLRPMAKVLKTNQGNLRHKHKQPKHTSESWRVSNKQHSRRSVQHTRPWIMCVYTFSWSNMRWRVQLRSIYMLSNPDETIRHSGRNTNASRGSTATQHPPTDIYTLWSQRISRRLLM